MDSRSPETKSRYIQDFNYYLRYLKVKNPNYLVIEKLLDDMKEIRKVEDQIIGYINHLKKQGLSSSTINGRLYAILKFYTANRVNLNRKHITQFKPQSKPVRKNDLAYTAEDIQKLLNYTTNYTEIRTKACNKGQKESQPLLGTK